MINKKQCFPFWLAVLATFSSWSQSKPVAASYFNKDDEGWTVVGDAQWGQSKPSFRTMNGNGYLTATDEVMSEVWYWKAPQSFGGNRLSCYNYRLKFDLRQATVENQFDDVDVILQSKDSLRVVFDTPQNPSYNWTSYSIPLNERAGWKLGNLDGPIPNQRQFKLILENLKYIWIRGEFMYGTDVGFLDNVVLEGPDLGEEMAQKGYSDVYGLYFKATTAQLKPESKSIIDQLVDVLRTNSALKISIEGHTSNEGDGPANQKLSEERANAVKAELVKWGIESTRINTVGYGATKPVAANDNETNRAKNRRVTVRPVR